MRNNLLLILGIYLVFFSCINKKKDPSPDCVVPDSLSFSGDIQPIFTKNCIDSDCHSGGNPPGGLNLSEGKSYQVLSKKGSGYLSTSDPKSSLLYSKLVTKNDPMPPDKPLSSCEIESIRKWMEQGALNN
jgi:hypothetical protein